MSKPVEIPKSRQEWASVSWQDSQTLLASLLSGYGFMNFEEKRLGEGSRADIVVYKSTSQETVIGVIEVKTYTKINSTIESVASKQVVRYLNQLYQMTEQTSNVSSKVIRYFACVVYTNDYPLSRLSKRSESSKNFLSMDILENRDTYIFSSRPEELITELQKRNLCGYTQSHLDKYFT